jgi:transcription elongation factor GreA
VVTGGGGDTVSVGSKVVVIKEGTDKEITYNIVGSEEASMAEGKISNRSPFGGALFGKKKGDTVIFETPKGSVKYKIIKVF